MRDYQLINELSSINEQEHIEYLGNKMLYDLCDKYPLHEKDQEIFAKIWLIGRSYAATLERGIGLNKDDNDLFYQKVVTIIMTSDFDKSLSVLKGKSLTVENITSIFYVYKKLHELTLNFERGQKHSFCSKYLHFHYPDLFFIYDSRAVESISKIKIDISMFKDLKSEYNNLPYFSFFLRCFQLREIVHKSNQIILTPRQIDICLVNWANERKRNNID